MPNSMMNRATKDGILSESIFIYHHRHLYYIQVDPITGLIQNNQLCLFKLIEHFSVLASNIVSF
jgi:hypothetical protein